MFDVRMAWLGLLLCVGLCGLRAPMATGAEGTISPSDVQKAAEEDPKICKRFKPTGSNIARSYCFRKSRWDAMREDAQRAVDDARGYGHQAGQGDEH